MRLVKLTRVEVFGVTVPVEMPAFAVEDDDDAQEINAKATDILMANLRLTIVPATETAAAAQG